MGKIKAVVWDADNVWYKGIGTSHCAKKSKLDPQPYIDGFIKDGWFTYNDVKRWAEYRQKDTNNPIQTVGDLAQCLTDFLYELKTPGSDKSIITKEQTIEGKQALLKGLTKKDIQSIAKDIEYTHGLLDSVSTFRQSGMYQTVFSDGLGPFIAYKAMELGITDIGVVPIIVLTDDEERDFDGYNYTEISDFVLIGKVKPYNKAEDMFNRLSAYDKSEMATIDDSGNNVDSILVPVRNAGGIAIGFNPTESHIQKFKEAGIPVLQQKERSLEPFKEIVLSDGDERIIAKYCV